MYLSCVVGTRPEIIKMSPIIRECRRRGISYSVLHTGQHYSSNLDKIFFEEMGIPSATHNLDVGSSSFGQQLGAMLSGLEKLLTKERPTHVLAEGDTNSVLAAALVASNLQIPFVHVEAGLRSYNMLMQEEKNRIVADRLADILLSPTEWTKDILLKEGADPRSIFVTGNTIVDVLYRYLPIAEEVSSLDKFGVESGSYFLATLHRAENTDRPEVLEGMLNAMDSVAQSHGTPVIFPIHPRTKASVQRFGLRMPSGLQTIEPVGFYDFLLLEKNTRLTFTDSGGVQEECCILHVPCITLRDDTERPETLHMGSNVLAGTHPANLEEQVTDMLGRAKDWDNPFGDGRAGERILEILSDPETSKALSNG